jgi:hypothetical protein
MNAMKAILSSVDGEPLAYHYRVEEADDEHDSLPPENILQCAMKLIPAGETFRAHTHLPLRRTTVGTHEAWVVIRGGLYAGIYDVNDSFCVRVYLGPGDCLVTVRGGHDMETSASTLLYEFKNGPYLGQAKDKRWVP